MDHNQNSLMLYLKNLWSRIYPWIKPIPDSINASKAWIKTKTRPITDPFKPYLRPVYNRWAGYKARNPRIGKVISLTAKAGILGFFILVFLILLVRIGVFAHIPSNNELRNIENANATEIYSMDSVLLGKFYIENRTEIDLDRISPYVITALLAVEDKRFFEHSGIDLVSWLRVFKGVVSNSSNYGGGSTLSQQLAKNLYPRRSYAIPGISMLINKIRENIISIKLEGIYNKEELLNLYLNTVPFGGNRYGINVASRYFYNKRSAELTPDEAATLVGMLKATTALDPSRNPENAKKRRNLVLNRMLQNRDFQFNTGTLTTVTELIAKGRIDSVQYLELIEKPIHAGKNVTGSNEGIATYFREYLRSIVMPNLLSKLKKDDGTDYNLYQDGLKIYTTVHSELQKSAEMSVTKHMNYLQKEFAKHWKGYPKLLPWGDDKWIDQQVEKSERYTLLAEQNIAPDSIRAIFEKPVRTTVFDWRDGGTDVDTMLSPLDSIRHYFTMLNCGLLVMDQSKGFIRAWVGGTNFKYFKYDHVLSSRQAGSTFKPIVYGAALIEGQDPCHFYENKQITIGDWTPRNSDGDYGGYYSMVGGLTYSMNTIAAQLIEEVGLPKTMALAKKMGVTSRMPYEAGISLGGLDVSLFDMIKVYGTIGNKGLRPEPVVVLKVTTKDGKVIYDYFEELEKDPTIGPHERAMEEKTAATLTAMMENVVIRGTGSALRSRYVPNGSFAGKTGTTQNNSDGWFISFNPHLVVGAWVGAPSPAVRFRTMALGSGAAMALPIVGQFWYELTKIKTMSALAKGQFERSDEVYRSVQCPLRSPVSQDTLDILMQDTFIAREILNSSYDEIQEIYYDYFDIEHKDSLEMAQDSLRIERRERRRENRQRKLHNIADDLKEILGVGN